MSPRAALIIEHAHAAGVRVVITFESFGAKQETRSSCEGGVPRYGRGRGDGIRRGPRPLTASTSTWRGLDGADRPAFGLLGDLAGSIHAANPAAECQRGHERECRWRTDGQIALDVGADRSFLMGYAYRVASSPAVGGIAPYTGVGTTLDLVRSLDLYEANGVAPEEILLGLPHYPDDLGDHDGRSARSPPADQRRLRDQACIPAAHRGRGRAAARPDALTTTASSRWPG